jgi:hypothetical protein
MIVTCKVTYVVYHRRVKMIILGNFDIRMNTKLLCFAWRDKMNLLAMIQVEFLPAFTAHVP